MTDIDNIMNDVVDALNVALKEGCDGDIVEDAIAKVRAVVVPVISEQQDRISVLENTNEDYLDQIDGLSDEVDELRGEKEDREHEDKRQELIKMFNIAVSALKQSNDELNQELDDDRNVYQVKW